MKSVVVDEGSVEETMLEFRLGGIATGTVSRSEDEELDGDEARLMIEDAWRERIKSEGGVS